jgi:hypothetical protein
VWQKASFINEIKENEIQPRAKGGDQKIFQI